MGTISESIGWLQSNPILIVLFLVVGIFSGLGEVVALFSIVGFLIQLYVSGIAHLVARDELAGKTTDIGAASSVVLGRMFSLIGIALITVILGGIGFLLFIIPGIYITLRLSLAPAACVIDGKDAFDSLGKSWDVAQGNLLKLLGITILFLVVMFAAIIGLVPLAVFVDSSGTLSMVLLVGLVTAMTAFVAPVIQLAYARIYLENRGAGADDVREDGIDRNADWAGA
ncbi:hypothetical protein C479_13018 [Halovivax asiaticus JCM 14624]|uniref:DUF7847 domain-containing protein n=1 Tax=Halovivax asiaticus JCM 14624 TaxID=1227490 RepID=M0BBG5_9EURY|nr:hypothetical protein [Halovivax asiaticus]ELZ08261.1 hypothetical protein C479_13018 [Halovivax asiaticus JCM 14624]